MRHALLTIMLVLSPACGMIPAEMREPIDKAIKDYGAGNYYLACQLGKDDKQVLGLKGDITCTANMLQLTGCHKKGVTVEGPK